MAEMLVVDAEQVSHDRSLPSRRTIALLLHAYPGLAGVMAAFTRSDDALRQGLRIAPARDALSAEHGPRCGTSPCTPRARGFRRCLRPTSVVLPRARNYVGLAMVRPRRILWGNCDGAGRRFEAAWYRW